jgi:DNA-binding SARP family transcriptional activator
MGAVVRVRLLGPVDVVAENAERTVSGLRRKAVLATLALHAGEIVSTDRLAHIVWGDSAPPTALNTLQSHVSHLRAVLRSKAAILAKPPGYVLDLGDEGTDVLLAERLLRRASQLADPVHAAARLREALALWRGEPLADLAGIAWIEQQAERLDLLCDQIRRSLAEARLASGEHAQLVPELARMVAGHPLDEGLHAQLMLALYRSGRQADALAVYQRLRATLGEQLGIDPSQVLRDLETAILRQDASLSLDTPAGAVTLAWVAAAPPPACAPAASSAACAPSAPSPAASAPAACAPAPLPVPAQLPPAIAGFAGRDAELASLDALLKPPAPARAVVISAIAGTAGVGKTALALHWAHRVRDRFPDGQLYVNLRGFDPRGPVVDPDQALRGFIDALGVPSERVPDDVEAKTGLFRSLLDGKRVLVVLDNARDTEQVRPLLPGSAGCLALVTSRNQLTGLIVAEGACPLGLDLLTVTEADDLLSRRLGARRVAAERQAAEEIVASCARLPLALTIAAARAAARPGFPLTAIAAELRQAAALLDPFDGGELALDVRAVFGCSYRALSGDAARLFRMLGLHPGPDISLAAAASLACVPAGRARTLLDELSRAHLLTEHSPGRFTFHDLLRAYAAELAATIDDAAARDAALRRVIDHFLQTGHAAAKLTEPLVVQFSVASCQTGVTAGELGSADDADEWFSAEYCTLLAAVRLAADAGLATQAWQLACSLTSFQLREGYWHDHEQAQRSGLEAARRGDEAAGEAYALLALALGYARAGRDDEAEPLFAQSLRLFERLGGHRESRAMIHSGLAWLSERRHRPAEALRHLQQAHDLRQAAGNRLLQAMALNDLGYGYALVGNHKQAIDCCERALAGIQEFDEPSTEAAIWHSIGFIRQRLGDHWQAIGCYERSLGLARSLCDRFNEADTLASIGDTHASAGDAIAARRAWTDALRVFEEIQHPDAELVRAKLDPDRVGRALRSA